jgi:hypothetical protein
MKIHQSYKDIAGQHIEFTVSYYKENGQYRLSAYPVKISTGNGVIMKEFGAFTGFTDLLLVVQRKSKNRDIEAVKVMESKMPQYIEWFEEKYGTKEINNTNN